MTALRPVRKFVQAAAPFVHNTSGNHRLDLAAPAPRTAPAVTETQPRPHSDRHSRRRLHTADLPILCRLRYI